MPIPIVRAKLSNKIKQGVHIIVKIDRGWYEVLKQFEKPCRREKRASEEKRNPTRDVTTFVLDILLLMTMWGCVCLTTRACMREKLYMRLSHDFQAVIFARIVTQTSYLFRLRRSLWEGDWNRIFETTAWIVRHHITLIHVRCNWIAPHFSDNPLFSAIFNVVYDIK